MVDILVLGATGYTGRLVVKYLANHPQRSSFTFAIGARSKSKGEALKRSLAISDDAARIVQVDVLHYEEVVAAVKETRVVLNLVGPYWLWGQNVVRACALQGKRYVDLTGELHFVKRMIDMYDHLATQTGAIIVPSCGFDSIPADILVFLSNRTLKNALGPETQLGLSQTFYDLKGGLSGGTVASLITELERVPPRRREEARQDYAISPVDGYPSPEPVLNARVPFSSPVKYGTYWIVENSNRGIVQRTFGLNALLASHAHVVDNEPHPGEKEAQIRPFAYGPQFRYAEYMVTGGSDTFAKLFGTLLKIWFALLYFSPVRWLVKVFGPKSGQGPSKDALKNGFMKVTNYTEAASSPGTYAKSVISGKGDPGYLLTSYMISECALALVLDDASLPVTAKLGGVLTPATALGSVLVSRLEATGQIKLESEIVRVGDESRKNR